MLRRKHFEVLLAATVLLSLVVRSYGQANAAVLQCYNCMYTNAITEVGAQCMNPAGVATSQLDPTIVQVVGCSAGQCYMYDITDQIGLHTTIRGCMQSQSQYQCSQQGVTCCQTSDLCNNLDTRPITSQGLNCYQCQYNNFNGINNNIGCLSPNSKVDANNPANITTVLCPGSCFTSVVIANDLVTQIVTRGCTTIQPEYSCSSSTCCADQSFCNGNSMAYIPAGAAAHLPAVALLLLAVASAFSL